MEFTEAVKIAASSLWAHKLRSVLTLLGVVIGVMSVIAVVSFINGLNAYVSEKIFNLGADVFLVNRGPSIITNIDDWQETQRRKKLTLEDFEAVRDGCRQCKDIGATASQRVEVKYSMNSVKDSNLRGYTPSMPVISDVELTMGRHASQSEYLRAADVCVVGWDIYENLFPGVDPLDKEIRLNNQSCLVIGVGKKLGSALGQTRDNWVITPLTAFRKTYGTSQSLRLWGKAESTSALEAARDEVRQILRGRRHLRPRDKDDFVVETNESFLSIWAGISSAFFGLVVIIASISLIVGGIVIMNIMLVSVTERTREIGLRKSIGARRNDILMQFLIESSTIAAIGGLWGVAGGILVAEVVSWVTPLPSAVKPWSVVLGLLVSTFVGLFFGIYPASKAAKLDPVEALRAE
ncbi:MAG: ABC transporter permease [Acidobacteria bacterium]|nr:ABC transporter permease [Acidobacteriota bacterium]